ncbi:hypothetical protein D9M71_166910 [compost metagenome]
MLFHAPVFTFGFRCEPGERRRLLPVETIDAVTALSAGHAKARAGGVLQATAAQVRGHTASVGQGHKEAVIERLVFLQIIQLGVDPCHRTEQQQRLIHQIAAQITQETTATAVVHRLWRIAFDPRFETGDLPQRTGLDEFAHGEKVRVPAPVLVDAQLHTLALGHGDQGLRLLRVSGERLVADHRHIVFDGVEHQRRATFERCGHYQHIDPDFDQLADAVEGRHAGVFCRQQLAPLR